MGNEIIETTYSVVAERTPDIIALEINTIKDQTAKIIISNSIEIGRKLTEAKSMLDHGQWGGWLQEKVRYSQDTAGNLMKIFEEYGADQIDIFGTANSETFRNLGYSQAVALLAIPKDEREDFVDAVGAENLSIRELKEKIKEYEDGKAAIEQRAEEAENKNNELKSAQEYLERRIADKETEIARLEKEVEKAENIAEIASATASEKIKENGSDEDFDSALDRHVKEMENLKKELDEARAESTVLKFEHEKEIAAAQQEKEKAVAEAREQAAQDATKDVEAKLSFKSNKDVIKFSILVEEIQKKYNEAIGILTPIIESDPEQGQKLTQALRQILSGYLDFLKE